ncbi:head maturation protease, ClpP-related [Enterocloster clostridioformis]|uniref:head maturation protease, ClpP-related n=1 Tax=Enterocloster clostridioformis TaxID=1531 RepID=UPI0034A20D98
MMKKFWNWRDRKVLNETAGEEITERVLELYGTIAEESWFDDDVTPEMFRQELFAGSGPVTIWINSPGGDCIAASQIYTMLMDYKGDVTVKIDGIAASAASVIAMAGTKVLMSPTGMLMIHNPATIAFGDHVDMQKAIEMLAEVKESIINAYEIKTSLPRKQLSRMMDDTTWMNAKKAQELGFIDGILEDAKRNAADISAYAFSASSVEMALVNKLTAKLKPQEPVTPAGRSVDELKKRLADIKQFIW